MYSILSEKMPSNNKSIKHVSFRSDNVKALSGLTTATDECDENIDHEEGTPCSSKKIINVIKEFVIITQKSAKNETKEVNPNNILPSAPTEESTIIRTAANILDCTSESCVVTHPSLRKFIIDRTTSEITTQDLENELDQRFKVQGPRNSLELLSNEHIDKTLQRWARSFPDFFPCPFAMMDFNTNGDFFGSVSLPSILDGDVQANLGNGIVRKNKFQCFGCVVNTDVRSGIGKHWVAIFVDCRPKPEGTSMMTEPWSVEYFNSTGRPPPKTMLYWMEHTRSQLANYRSSKKEYRNTVNDVITVAVSDMNHQQSRTECGLYALFYIRRRLEKVPYSFFDQQIIPDSAMTEFRQHVFRSN